MGYPSDMALDYALGPVIKTRAKFVIIEGTFRSRLVELYGNDPKDSLLTELFGKSCKSKLGAWGVKVKWSKCSPHVRRRVCDHLASVLRKNTPIKVGIGSRLSKDIKRGPAYLTTFYVSDAEIVAHFKGAGPLEKP